MTNLICPCCHQNDLKPFHYQTQLCLGCGHAWFPASQLDINFKELYGESYFHGGDYGNYEEDEKELKFNFQKYIQRMLQHIPKDATVLEVGCAYGYFLEVAQDHFEVEGIDITTTPVQKARDRGLPALEIELLDVDKTTTCYDAICLWDTLEHLPDPGGTMEQIRNLLKEKGYVFLTTGDRSSPLAKLQQKNWRHFHPPSHLQYFTRKSIRQLLEQHGMETISISSIAQWHSIRNVLSGFHLHGKTPVTRKMARLLSRITPQVIQGLSLPLPTGDIMWVVGQKK